MRSIDEVRLSPVDRQAIQEATEALRSVLDVERIVLFGSKARGDDDPESDIDLLVLTHGDTSSADRYRVVDALYPIELRLGVVVSPLLVQTEEWRSGLIAFHPIHAEIEEQGVAA
jgi:predicted nucleotidyltransferase